jgi:hypothetical protein
VGPVNQERAIEYGKNNLENLGPVLSILCLVNNESNLGARCAMRLTLVPIIVVYSLEIVGHTIPY